MAATAARTPAACRIARLTQPKFNDVMASGEYVCAPDAAPGLARIFEMPDLIGLYLFARLIEKGRTVPQAANVVCQIVSKLREAVNNGQELPEHVAIAYGIESTSFISFGTDANPFASNFGGGGAMHEIMFSEVWNIANLKRRVEQGLAEESRIVG